MGRRRRTIHFIVLAVLANAVACGSDRALTQVDDIVNTVAVNLGIRELNVGQTVQADAVARSASGGALSGVTLTWSSSNPNVASVTSGGMVTAVSPGKSDITAAAGAMSATVTVTVLPTTPTVQNGACPNEPGGYARFNEQSWDAVPVKPGLALDPSGWLDDHGDAASKTPIVSDPTSPFPSTNHNVAAGFFPAGSPGGSAPFYVYRPFASSERFKKLYICMYMKHSANFNNTNGNGGTKFMWPAGDQSQGTQLFAEFQGDQMEFGFMQQAAVDRTLGANVNSAAAQVAGRKGQWVKYEWLFQANTNNSTADGKLDVWIDGVLTHHYTNVNWQMTSTRTWLSLAWNPTYGWGINPVPHDQWEYIDHIRLSGSNQ